MSLAAVAVVSALLAMTGAPAGDQPMAAPQVPARACLDSLGVQAECGRNFPHPSTCYAADAFGRCDGDPRCFAPDGFQVRCVPPVRRIVQAGCPGPSVIALNAKGLVTRIASFRLPRTAPTRRCPADQGTPF